MTLSTQALEAVNAAQTDVVFIVLLTISGGGLVTPIRLASDTYEFLPTAGVRGVVSRGDEYIYLPFEVILPMQDDTGITRAKLSIDNIDRQIVSAVRSATSALVFKIEIVLSTDVNVVEMSLPDLKLTNVNYDAFKVQGDLEMDYLDLEPFPSQRFTPSFFQGIF